MKKIILLLMICQNSLGQITLTPNAVGMNASAENNVLTSQGNGLVVQKKYTETTVDPNTNIHNISCVIGTPAVSALAGIIKDPNGDLPYTAGISYFCGNNIFNNPQPYAYLITFISLDLGIGDAVSITSDFGIQSFTGNTLPQPFIVKSLNFATGAGGFTVQFFANGDGSVGQGFAIKYQAIPNDVPATGKLESFTGGKSMFFNSNNGSFGVGMINAGQPKGNYSIGMGFQSEAIGENSIALGFKNTSSHTNSVAIGSLNELMANAINSVAVGHNNSIQNQSAVSLGSFNNNSGYGSLSLGNQLNSKSKHGVVIGYSNNIGDNPNTVIESLSDRIFQVGNGFVNRSNALTILRNGDIGIGNSSLALAPDSRLVIDGFTRLGTDAPKIKMKEISGNMPAANGNGNYPHGLTDTQILSIVVSAEVSNQFIPPNYTGNPSLEYNYYWASGNLYILNKNLNSSGLAGVPFKALITYKE